MSRAGGVAGGRSPRPPCELSPMGRGLGGQRKRGPCTQAEARRGVRRRGWRRGPSGSRPGPVVAPWRGLLVAWLTFASAVQGAEHLQLRRPRRQPGQGTWTPWGGWSVCSSTCGEGASFRSRGCIRFPEEEPCPGKARQYRVCETAACPSGAVPFREVQCSLYDGRPALGAPGAYRWVPFHGAPNLCDLNCLAEGHNFYYTFGRALDGTPCSPHSQGLCINGRCLQAGCDGILDSEAQEDACGVCNGRNASCVLVQEVFWAPLPTSGYFGYKNVVWIPAGARHLRVTDRSRNYLALMEANRRYVLNGGWAIDGPGVYEAAGTQVRYSRVGDVQESLEAEGPTREDLLLLVLFQEPSQGIEYQFWLPRERPRQPQSDTSPLRQPQTREAEEAPLAMQGTHHSPGATATAAPRAQDGRQGHHRQPQGEATLKPPKAPTRPGKCGTCATAKGRTQRLHHYCSSDFVFRARIVSKQPVGQETRYDLRVREAYRSRFRLAPREYLWVANTCDCPPLAERREYVLMARRHVNFEHTRNRLLLPRGGYARPWSPREDQQLREAARHCGPATRSW